MQLIIVYRIGKCDFQPTTQEQEMIELIVYKALGEIKTLCEKHNAIVVVTKTVQGEYTFKPECKDYDTLMLMYHYMHKAGLK